MDNTKKRNRRKKRTMFKSALFKRYLSRIVLIILACLFTLGVTMLLLVTNYWWNEKSAMLQENSDSLVELVAEKHLFASTDDKDFKNIAETLALVSKSTQSDYFICDTNGNVIVCAHSTGVNTVCKKHSEIQIKDTHQDKELTKALENGFTIYSSLSGSLGRSCFVVATPIVHGDNSAGTVIAVEDVMVGLLPYVQSITKMFLLSGFISLLIALLASYVFSYGIAKPLTEMTNATNEFAKGNFDIRVSEDHKKGELKQLAQALNKMAGDLEIEDTAKKSFVANVSHELKTPMTTIGGFIDGILDGTIPENKQAEYLSVVSTEVKRLARLVVSMLNLSKIESGEIQLSPIEYDILPQIFETMLSFEPVIEKNKISVEGFETLEGIKICADKDLLHQVVYNLVDNAVKFTPVGGVITLHADSNEQRTKITITNSGSGVDPEEIKHIFERFYKVDKSRSFDIKGVGLGLYIVKTIINMHGGTIVADSKLNESTQFSFTIPFKQD